MVREKVLPEVGGGDGAELRVLVLGGTELAVGGRPLVELASAKAAALLALMDRAVGLARVLREELGVEPSAAPVALRDEIAD